MRYIDDADISNKVVLLRVDYNVSLNKNHRIANDERVRQSVPTIELLLKKHNTLIIISHLGRPHGKESALSLKPIATDLSKLLGKDITFVSDIGELQIEITRKGNLNRIFLLENIRFYKGEEDNDISFAKALVSLADVYVNDAFSVSHRKCASITQLPKLLPSYAGLLMKKEVETISQAIKEPKHPLVSILGGAKISTKLHLIDRLIEISDFVLLGGALANTFLLALKNPVGRSLVERDELSEAFRLIEHAKRKRTRLLLPTDVIVGDKDGKKAVIKPVHMISSHDTIYDIGPETQAIFAQAILQAKTIIWNGPVGLFEEEAYCRGTDFIYYAITANKDAISIVGGGETIAAIAHEEHLDKITHISTGGGAMLEYIEKGTLIGIDALESSKS